MQAGPERQAGKPHHSWFLFAAVAECAQKSRSVNELRSYIGWVDGANFAIDFRQNESEPAMTQAVCFKCGEIKFGAFCPCLKCHATPATEDDLVISMAMTDHYFDLATLQQMGESVRVHGKPPNLDPESRRGIVESLRQMGDIEAMLKSSDLEEMLKTAVQDAEGADLPVIPKPPHKPWWKFW